MSFSYVSNFSSFGFSLYQAPTHTPPRNPNPNPDPDPNPNADPNPNPNPIPNPHPDPNQMCHALLTTGSLSYSCRCSSAAEAPPATAYRLPPTAYRLPPIAYRLPPTAYRLPPTAYRPPTAGRYLGSGDTGLGLAYLVTG